MRNAIVSLLLLFVSIPCWASQACLHVMGEVNGVFCPKCSDPGASQRIASKKVGKGVCLSCQFYCLYTAVPGGGEHRFLPLSGVDSPGCLPSDAERSRVVEHAIPVALHMGRADFARVAHLSPAAATALAAMLWRGDDSTMTDAREFSAQFRQSPSYADAMAVFEDFEANIDLPGSEWLPDREFLHVDVKGERTGEDGARLTVRTLLDAGGSRVDTHEPITITLALSRDEVATSFAGHAVVARHAWATVR